MTFVVAATWVPREGAGDEIESILRELASQTRTEPACIEFIVHRSRTSPNEFFLYEQYDSEQDWLDHQKTEHFAALVLGRAIPLLERRERHTFDLLY